MARLHIVFFFLPVHSTWHIQAAATGLHIDLCATVDAEASAISSFSAAYIFWSPGWSSLDSEPTARLPGGQEDSVFSHFGFCGGKQHLYKLRMPHNRKSLVAGYVKTTNVHQESPALPVFNTMARTYNKLNDALSVSLLKNKLLSPENSGLFP